MKLVHAFLMMAAISTTTSWRTPAPRGLNLNGKMFTLSLNRGGISFYPPSWPSTPSSTTSPYYTNTPPYTRKHPYTTTQHYPTTSKHPYTTTQHYPTTTKRPYITTRYPYTTTQHYPTTTTHPYTTTRHPYTRHPYTTSTAPSARGVSVCLRYLTDFVQISNPRFFKLSPSSTPLQVNIDRLGGCTLNFDPFSYNTMYLTPSIRFWSNIGPDIWSRVCLTLDSMKNVAQVFSGSNISIRKVIPNQYVWSGEPVIEFEGFDGQVTDVQMWDYPLSYREVFKYMTSGVYGLYRGSVLTWSSISYTPKGNTLLEDVYEWQTKQKIIGRRRGRQPEGGRKNRKFVNVEEREKGKRDQLV
ncbi:uncharacterized protein LOC115584140 [Sparus aurata]|uniref:uncharacterized protein LOC115584140 n=1 Tax=Sparus aurata TaxID=8175 RepID=UPI0011C11D0A|nr:uncharacterized protein LOC115584140 [Sparus aurata]